MSNWWKSSWREADSDWEQYPQKCQGRWWDSEQRGRQSDDRTRRGAEPQVAWEGPCEAPREKRSAREVATRPSRWGGPDCALGQTHGTGNNGSEVGGDGRDADFAPLGVISCVVERSGIQDAEVRGQLLQVLGHTRPMVLLAVATVTRSRRAAVFIEMWAKDVVGRLWQQLGGTERFPLHVAQATFADLWRSGGVPAEMLKSSFCSNEPEELNLAISAVAALYSNGHAEGSGVDSANEMSGSRDIASCDGLDPVVSEKRVLSLSQALCVTSPSGAEQSCESKPRTKRAVSFDLHSAPAFSPREASPERTCTRARLVDGRTDLSSQSRNSALRSPDKKMPLLPSAPRIDSQQVRPIAPERHRRLLVRLRRRWAFAESRFSGQLLLACWRLEAEDLKRQRRGRQLQAVYEGRLRSHLRRTRVARMVVLCFLRWRAGAADLLAARAVCCRQALEAALRHLSLEHSSHLARSAWRAWVAEAEGQRALEQVLLQLAAQRSLNLRHFIVRTWAKAVASTKTDAPPRPGAASRSVSAMPALWQRMLEQERASLLRLCLSKWAALSESGRYDSRVTWLEGCVRRRQDRHQTCAASVVRMLERRKSRCSVQVALCLWIAHAAREREVRAQAECFAEQEMHGISDVHLAAWRADCEVWPADGGLQQMYDGR